MVSWTKPTKCMQECRRHRVLKPPCISAGTRGELCGCCCSERFSWQSCLWCCCRSGPRAEKNPAGDELNCMGLTLHEMVHWLFMYGEEQFHKSRPTSAKKGKGGIPVQAMSCCTVLCKSNYITVSCHVAHYITFCSRNSGLENGDRELGHLFCYYRNCKNNSIVAIYRFSESVHTLQQVRFHVCIIWNPVTSSNWLHSSGLYTQFTMQPLLWKWVWLARLGEEMIFIIVMYRIILLLLLIIFGVYR